MTTQCEHGYLPDYIHPISIQQEPFTTEIFQSYFYPSTSGRDRGTKVPPSSSIPSRWQSLRDDFPILHQKVHGKPLIWLDNAATAQKPRIVIEAISRFYHEDNSNIHRGAHALATRATEAYEDARKKIQKLLGAAAPEEIIFVRGATEAINLVAQTFGRTRIGKGDEILLTTMEHHSNIVPWQMLQQTSGATLRVVPIHDRGQIRLDEYEKLLSRRTRMVALTHLSNVLGTVNPVRTMVEMAHHYGATVLIDGAQAVPRIKVDLQELDADFYTFSGHKAYGPTGVGVLFGKKELLEEMPPWQGGGGMIRTVTFENTTYQSLPQKFEAGTGNIADAVGLGCAVDYLQSIGITEITVHEEQLTAYTKAALAKIPGLRLIGDSPRQMGVISFTLDGASPEDIAQKLDQDGIAVRAGHHCAQPLLEHYGLTSTLRASLGLYNTEEEIEVFVESLRKIGRQK